MYVDILFLDIISNFFLFFHSCVDYFCSFLGDDSYLSLENVFLPIHQKLNMKKLFPHFLTSVSISSSDIHKLFLTTDVGTRNDANKEGLRIFLKFILPNTVDSLITAQTCN